MRRRLARATRRERLRLGLTQEEAAERAGMATRQLQRVEAGTVNAGLILMRFQVETNDPGPCGQAS
jgi:predicted transcriptional regulator